MGDYKNFYCEHCGRHTRHKRIEPEEELFKAWNEVFDQDDWRCTKCGRSRAISRLHHE